VVRCSPAEKTRGRDRNPAGGSVRRRCWAAGGAVLRGRESELGRGARGHSFIGREGRDLAWHGSQSRRRRVSWPWRPWPLWPMGFGRPGWAGAGWVGPTGSAQSGRIGFLFFLKYIFSTKNSKETPLIHLKH
jgi:hypothetical protein